MILKYGNYAHALGEAVIAITATALFNARGVQYATRQRWEISGFLQAGTPAAITAAINGMQAAYAVPGRDLTLYLNDGVTRTSHCLSTAAAIGGVRIVAGPSFPEGRGAEYTTFRSYQITAEADLPIDDSTANDPTGTISLWEETLSFTGGGARFVYLQTINGLPQRQQVASATPFRVVQAGRAIGTAAYPQPNQPFWPAAEHVDRRAIERKSPQRSGLNTFTHYEITWQYNFESESPLAGVPTAH